MVKFPETWILTFKMHHSLKKSLKINVKNSKFYSKFLFFTIFLFLLHLFLSTKINYYKQERTIIFINHELFEMQRIPCNFFMFFNVICSPLFFCRNHYSFSNKRYTFWNFLSYLMLKHESILKYKDEAYTFSN